MRMVFAVKMIVLAAVLLGGLTSLGFWPSRIWAVNPEREIAVALRRIQELQDLTVLRVPVQFIHEGSIAGRLGGIRCLLDVHGFVDLGVDLSQARLVDLDHEHRTATLQLPDPHVISARLDLDATRIHRVDRWGLWHLVAGEAGARQVVQKALKESERLVHKNSQERIQHEQARGRAQAICNEVASKLGWRVK